jgi:hypothetical protein
LANVPQGLHGEIEDTLIFGADGHGRLPSEDFQISAASRKRFGRLGAVEIK